jgi:HAD superfamily hydrolase (TIGR01549 family)
MKLRALLFDYGGTLDGGGVHWLDRFLQHYRDDGLDLSFEQFRAAFDYATQCCYADPAVASLGLEGVVRFHVARHLEQLGVPDGARTERICTAFLRGARANLAASRGVLERLHRRVALGVVSNFYGNVDRLLAEAGIACLLDTIVDSARVGVSKPDPAIFLLAVRQLGCQPEEAMYVGDSFDKDVVGAHAAGLRTAWLVGLRERSCPQPDLVDVRLHNLSELETLVCP